MSCVASPMANVGSMIQKSSGCLSPTIPTLNLHCPPSSPRPPPAPPSPAAASPRTSVTVGVQRRFWEGERESSVACSSSSTPLVPGLRRKRPARISIPVAAPPLGFGVNTPKPEEIVKEVEVDGDGYSVYCKKGARSVMEDRYSAIVGLQGDPKQALFGVFDGHGGVQAADFAANNIHKNIMEQVTRRSEGETDKAIQEAYITTDAEFLQQDANGGSCCLTTLIRQGNIVVSNAGDCRAVMSRNGVAEALTSDHRPSSIEERERIQKLGGYVDCCRGVWRIQGSLAVSRGIGDRNLKQWVIAEPETKVLSIDPGCEFLILATDGLWDKVSNEEAVEIARSLCTGLDKPETLSACKKLADLSANRGCIDDISVMIIQLGSFAS